MSRAYSEGSDTYRKKPVTIRALRWTGDNTEEIREFTDGGFREIPLEHRTEEQREQDVYAEVWDYLHSTWVGVKVGQWIIKGVQGEHYPCDPDVFEATYEEALARHARSHFDSDPSFKRLIQTVREGGADIEIDGVKITRCDEFGRTDRERALLAERDRLD